MIYYVRHNCDIICSWILGGGYKMSNFIVILYVIYYIYQGVKTDFAPFISVMWSRLYTIGWTVGLLRMALWELKYDSVMDVGVLVFVVYHLGELIYREAKRV